MSARVSNEKTCACVKESKPHKQSKGLSYILGLSIAILPKCPFCIFGYSTVLTMCSGERLHEYTPSTYNWLPVVLSVLLIGSFTLNFKGTPSIVAMLVSIIGAVVIAYTQFFAGDETLYYVGVALLLISIFVNGRFSFLLNRRSKAPIRG